MTGTGWISIKKGDCPVCGPQGKQHSNNCQQSHTVLGLVLCRASQVDPTIQPLGYKHLGETQCGTWAKWIESDESHKREWTQEQQEQWRLEQQQKYEKQEQSYQDYLKRLLSVDQRNEEYQFLAKQFLTLSDHHRTQLQNQRKLTPEEIDFIYELGWIRTWATGKVVKGLSPTLAGIHPQTGKLLSVAGISVACLDGENRILGHQVVTDDRQKFDKCLWLSSKSKGGSGPHLPNGELPLFVWRHPEATTITETWLVEGNLKSLITAMRLWFREDRKDIQVIGASGAQWCGSKEFFKSELARQSTKKVVLCPDAGALQNPGILKHCKDVVALVVEWGYSPYVGWWDQDTKGDDPDIDELTDYSLINFINPCDFFKQANPDKDENLPPEWAWKNWVKSKTFTPTQTVHLEEFHFGKLPESDVVVAANSGLATNKTGAMIEVKRLSGRRSHIIGYRNNLLIQTCSRAAESGVDILHIREDDGASLIRDVHTNLAFCVDSIHQVDGYFKDTDIYLDETCSVLMHIVNGGTLAEKQGTAIKIFTKALQECNRIFLLDGNLSDLYVDFIVNISGKKEVVKIFNTKKSRPHKLKIVVGIDVDNEVKKRDKSSLIKAMVAPGTIPWVASDSKTLTDTLHLIFQKYGKKGFVLNKDSASEDWAKDFLYNPNTFITTHKPDYFIISPTAESGVSCTVTGHFTDKFTIFTGIQGSNSQYQMLIRLRDNTIPHHIFCPERSMLFNRNTPATYSATALSKILQDKIIQSAILASQSTENPANVLETIGKAIARSNDDWWQFSVKLGALDQFEMNYLRRCLVYVLESAGHEVEIVNAQIDELFNEEEKQASEQSRLNHALEIYNAEEFESIEDANKLAKTSPRKEVQRRIEKTRLLDRLPEIKSSPVWNAQFIADNYLKDKDFISRQQRFWFLNHFEISKKRHEVEWYYKATKQDFYLSEAKNNSHLKVWALQRLNVLQFTTGEWHKDSPEVIAFVDEARKKEIGDALGIFPNPSTATGKERIDFVRSALALIGKKFKLSARKNLDGIRHRVYTVDTVADKDPARLEVLAAIDRKYSGYLESEGVKKVCWQPDYVEPPIPVETEAAAEPYSSSIPTLAELAQVQTPVSPLQSAVEHLEQVQHWEDMKLNQNTLNKAWDLLPLQEQQRLMKLHQEYKSVPVKDAVLTTVEDVSAIASSSTIDQDEVIYKVDREIQVTTPLFTLGEDVTTWRKRLDRALLLGNEIAKRIYPMVPPQLLNAVWEGLTLGVQDKYVQLFSG